MSRILVTGGKGKLGSELSKLIEGEFVGSKELDVTDRENVLKWIVDGKYDFVFHLAADTDLNGCEKDHKRAFRVNVLGTENVAEAVKKIQGVLIYPSTDYIFDGERGLYSENDPPNPVNYYSLTKLLSEYIVRGVPQHLVVRGTMKERGKWRHPVAPVDMYESLLHHDEFAEYTVKLVEREARGIFHIGKGRYSVYEWAKKFDPAVKPKTIMEIGFPLPRDCSLDTRKMEIFLQENSRPKIKIRKES